MVAPLFALLVAGATWLVVARNPRLGPWCLGVGALLFGFLWLLGQLRIPWPNFGVPIIFVLNPYLVASLSFVLLIAGGIGTVVKIARILRGTR